VSGAAAALSQQQRCSRCGCLAAAGRRAGSGGPGGLPPIVSGAVGLWLTCAVLCSAVVECRARVRVRVSVDVCAVCSAVCLALWHCRRQLLLVDRRLIGGSRWAQSDGHSGPVSLSAASAVGGRRRRDQTGGARWRWEEKQKECGEGQGWSSVIASRMVPLAPSLRRL